MNLANVMQAVADRLAVISGLNTFGYPVATVSPPAAIVTYPESISFDGTYRRGLDRIILPLVLVVGGVSDLSTRDAIGAYCDGSGPSSVKAVLESGSYTAFDTITVTEATFDVVSIAAVDYLAALFDLDIAGHGS